MTELLFHRDSYLKEFQATVQSVDENGVVLDRTGFYTGGGGQPPDTGVLAETSGDGKVYRVTGMGRSQGNVVHKPMPDRANCLKSAPG